VPRLICKFAHNLETRHATSLRGSAVCIFGIYDILLLTRH